MPPRDPGKVQLDFPELIADLISQLSLMGTVGLLDFDPVVRPVFIVGDRGLAITAQAPTFETAEIFSFNNVVLTIGLVLVDTGQLTAGIYDAQYGLSVAAMSGAGSVTLEHRNAANSANLASWPHAVESGTVAVPFAQSPIFSVDIGLNERFRWINDTAQAAASRRAAGWLMLARRLTP